MSFDYQLLSSVILDLLSAPGTATERMHRLIDGCNRQKPTVEWDAMRKIDFESDVLRAKGWIEAALHGWEGAERCRGLWFGLHNPVHADRATADLYVAASPEFNCANLDWAYSLFRTFKPVHFHSAALDSIYWRAYNIGTLGNDAEYPLVLGFGAMLALAALETFDSSKFHFVAGGAVGFDSGDCILLGSFSNGEFARNITAA